MANIALRNVQEALNAVKTGDRPQEALDAVATSLLYCLQVAVCVMFFPMGGHPMSNFHNIFIV
jgi:hypothetical protein